MRKGNKRIITKRQIMNKRKISKISKKLEHEGNKKRKLKTQTIQNKCKSFANKLQQIKEVVNENR